MAELTVQSIGSGAQLSFSAASAGGDEFQNDGKTHLFLDNQSGGDITVTGGPQNPCNQGFTHGHDTVAQAGGLTISKAFERRFYNDSTGKVQVTYSATASLTVAAVRIVGA